jgi:hypothetical protein
VHRRTRELTAHLDHHHAALHAALAGVPLGLREQAPAPDRWSAANIVEHLAIVETRIGQALGRRFDEVRVTGIGPAPATSVVADTDLTRYLDRERRIVSAPASWPEAGHDAPAALAALEAARAVTCRLVAEADGLDATPVTFPHPMFGVLTFYQWIVFLGGHEGRHARQIQEVGQVLATRS